MRPSLRKILDATILAGVLGLVAGLVFYLVRHALAIGSGAFLNLFLGAFSGAFFAFLFIRLGDALTRIHQRRLRHFNALVTLQHRLNDLVALIRDNIFITDDFLTTFSDEAINAAQLPLFINRLHAIPIDRELVIDLEFPG